MAENVVTMTAVTTTDAMQIDGKRGRQIFVATMAVVSNAGPASMTGVFQSTIGAISAKTTEEARVRR
jgi:hypothetical protein